MNTELSQRAVSQITFKRVLSYIIHGMTTYKFKQIGNYESVINAYK